MNVGSSVKRIRFGVLVTIALFLASVAIGVKFAGRFGTEEVLSEVERRLSDALGTPVQVGRLSVSPGSFIRVKGGGVTAWAGSNGNGLEIRQVSGSVDAVSLMGGEISLSRLIVEDAHLRLQRGPDGSWRPGTPEPQPEAVAGARGIEHPDELLGPLIALEVLVRRMLSQPHAATRVELRNVHVSFEEDANSDNPLALDDLNGTLVHRRFRNRSELSIRAELSEGGSPRGWIQLVGFRDRTDAIEIALSVDRLDLGTATRNWSAIGSEADVEGTLDGEWIYQTPALGSGHLEANLIASNLVVIAPGGEDRLLRTVRSPHVDLSGALEIDPQHATLHDLKIANQETHLALSGRLSRPLQPGSIGELDFRLANLNLSQARHLIGWLPEIEREESQAVLAPLRSGRLVSMRAQGAASLSHWQDLVAGRTRRVPRRLRDGGRTRRDRDPFRRLEPAREPGREADLDRLTGGDQTRHRHAQRGSPSDSRRRNR